MGHSRVLGGLGVGRSGFGRAKVFFLRFGPRVGVGRVGFFTWLFSSFIFLFSFVVKENLYKFHYPPKHIALRFDVFPNSER